MRLTVMVDLQCISFKAEGESEAKTAEGRGGDGAHVSEEEGRGCDSVEGSTNVAVSITEREMAQLGRVSRMVGRMRCTINLDF
jgi:hypothetical protein